MGTNFYLMKRPGEVEPTRAFEEDAARGLDHIGKRSAAGLYCWDCDMTLCMDGESGVHDGRSEWYNACPKCGKKPIDEGWASSAGRELGFNKEPPKRKTGVASCSSFSWSKDPDKVKEEVKRLEKSSLFKDVIQDEYDRAFTLAQFEAVLSECPIQYRHVGEEFR